MELESFGKDTISTIFGCKLRNVTDNTIKEFTDFFKIKEIPMRIKDEPRVKSESCSDVSISPEHSSR